MQIVTIRVHCGQLNFGRLALLADAWSEIDQQACGLRGWTRGAANSLDRIDFFFPKRDGSAVAYLERCTTAELSMMCAAKEADSVLAALLRFWVTMPGDEECDAEDIIEDVEFDVVSGINTHSVGSAIHIVRASFLTFPQFHEPGSN